MMIQQTTQYITRIAIRSKGQNYTYQQVQAAARQVSCVLLQGQTDLKEARIAFMVQGSFEYVAIQWGIWQAGGIAVPLCTAHPLPALEYVLKDTETSQLIVEANYEGLLKLLAKKRKLTFHQMDAILSNDSVSGDFPLPTLDKEQAAMILYTSGTTSLPKGVVTTHANIEAQITTLVEAWRWQQGDHILCVLPLHHVHGIINVVSCALWSGACVEFLPQFDAAKVFDLFLQGNINVFMAVPTVYYKLIAYWEQQNTERQAAISACLQKFRLMVSGSAALPISVLEKWRDISGHTLLERYGMTEIGMAVSNSYEGERRPGHIGLPLPGVHLRLVDEDNQLVEDGQNGEIQVKGKSIFKAYWQKPEATQQAFTHDGWFKTGDIAVFNQGSYRILGRSSVDIIKSGGYKIAALAIEEVLRTYPNISDCAVVGVSDEEWGEVVAASLILQNPKLSIDFSALKTWLKQHLPPYQVPRRFIIQADLPRNTLGKVTKNELKLFFE